MMKPEQDYTRGVAITSSWHPDENTHIEPVRYGKGSNAMGLLNTLMTDGGTRRHRWWQFLLTMLRNPLRLWLLVPRRWSERVIILLVMQTLNNSITVRRVRTRLGLKKLTSSQGEGEPNPTWIPVANQAARQLAENVGGMPGGTWGDLMNIPMTAHFIGGCAIGDSPATGVVDPYHRLYGHPGLHVDRRLDAVGEPRCEPLAVHHGAGRAGHGTVAEQGRTGPSPAARRRVQKDQFDHATGTRCSRYRTGRATVRDGVARYAGIAHRVARRRIGRQADLGWGQSALRRIVVLVWTLVDMCRAAGFMREK